MRRSLKLVVALLTAACSADLTETTTSVTPAPGTYVLTSMGSATTAPFVTLDLVCGAARVHRQFMTLGDTITIRGDGSARQAFTLATLENGLKTDSTYIALDGTWSSFNSAGSAFYGGYPSIHISIMVPSQSGGSAIITNTYRIEADGNLSQFAGSGGSCDGDLQPVQRFTATWTRI